MTAVLSSSSSSPSTSPQPQQPSSPAPSNVPPLGQTPTSNPRRTVTQRPQSFAQQSRMSTYSINSAPSHNASRPISHIFPIFHSSLPCAQVRDFAYSINTPLHFGPPAESSRATSGGSTPVSEFYRRLSDPNVPSWAGSSSTGGSAYQYPGEVPPFLMADQGPPYSEDEDLQSPVVQSSRNRKNKSTAAHLSGGSKRRAGPSERGSHLAMAPNGVRDRGLYTGTRADGSEIYYFDSAPEQVANGPGGEFVTYPPNQPRRSLMATDDGRRDSHFAAILPSRSYVSQNGVQDPVDDSDSDLSDLSSPPANLEDNSRISRDYQFSIASPDEEMHGKAVALFDFTRENENELPLTEGQVIWVSYRHGQGWLVAEDPKTRESGLVPEEYVRLLRDIEGGWGGLAAAEGEEGVVSPISARDASTPTQPNHPDSSDSDSRPDSNGQIHRPPVVSSFSTSSRDLDPYPQHLLSSEKPGQPPQVVHYHNQRAGSQANTPTQASASSEAFLGRRGSEDSR
jgi:hypothetical protein